MLESEIMSMLFVPKFASWTLANLSSLCFFCKHCGVDE